MDQFVKALDRTNPDFHVNAPESLDYLLSTLFAEHIDGDKMLAPSIDYQVRDSGCTSDGAYASPCLLYLWRLFHFIEYTLTNMHACPRTHAHELPAALICRPHATRPGLHGRHIFARLQLLYGLCQRSQVAYGQGEGRVGQNVECAIATACSKDFARLVTARGVCRTRLVVLAAGGDAKTKERCGKYKPNARKAPNGARRAQTKKN